MQNKKNVAILGCGAIYSRHINALNDNKEHYNLVGIYDIDPDKLASAKYVGDLYGYETEDAVYADNTLDIIVLATPSYLHYEQMQKAIANGKDVIVEKPAVYSSSEVDKLSQLVNKTGRKIFPILQVRMNQSFAIAKNVVESGLIGEIRGVSLVQRWQRPATYFDGWRGAYDTGGGVLSEFAIHYLDAINIILGMPEIKLATFYKHKFKHIEIHDTIYALFDFDNGKFGGTFEISIASEPSNLELKLCIMGSGGYIELGGKSLDVITRAEFLQECDKQAYLEIENKINQARINSSVSVGVSPNHPELYRRIAVTPELFDINDTRDVLQVIEQIYKFLPKQ